jgi:hypothetical protein
LNNQWLLWSSIVKLAGAFLNFFMTARAKRWWLYIEVAMVGVDGVVVVTEAER